MPVRMYCESLGTDVRVYGFVSDGGETKAVCYGETGMVLVPAKDLAPVY